jgi:hypothetical protein
MLLTICVALNLWLLCTCVCVCVQTPPPSAPDLNNGCVSRCVSNLAQVGTNYLFGQIHVYIKGSSDEIRSPWHWNLIGPNTSAPPSEVSPSSILPLPSSHCDFIPWRKIAAEFQRMSLYVMLICTVVSWLKRVVSGISPRRTGLDPLLHSFCYCLSNVLLWSAGQTLKLFKIGCRIRSSAVSSSSSHISQRT